MEEKDDVKVNYVEEKENSQEVPEEGKKKWWNKKRAIKVISISLVAVMLLSAGIVYFAPKIHWYYLDQKYFDGKKPFFRDRIGVKINYNYQDEFELGQLTKHFKFEVIDIVPILGRIPSEPSGAYILFLEKKGEKVVKQAVLDCEDLYFVEYAFLDPAYHSQLA